MVEKDIRRDRAQRWPVHGLTVLGLAALLGGCAMPRPFEAPKILADLPKPQSEVIEPSSPAEVEVAQAVEYNESSFVLKAMEDSSHVLPDVEIKRLSLSESGLQDALALMLKGTGLSLAIDGGPRGLERNGPVSLHGLSGKLAQVMEALSESMGFFWTVRDSTIVIQPERLFVVELPPVLSDDSLAGMTNTIQVLGAKDTYLDRMQRTLVLRCNARAYKKIGEYLAQIRRTRSMIVYEMQIFQVQLKDNNQQGINWNSMGGSSAARANGVSSTSPVGTVAGDGTSTTDLAKAFSLSQTTSGLGAVVMGPHFNLNFLVNFLKTQGTVQTVTQPRIAVLNGAKGALRVGETDTYVSKVGSNLASGISQVTVETKDLRTGLELSLIGEENDGAVTTRINLGLSDLIQFVPYTALGTSLNLPNTNDRELQTVMKLPAGYTALIGGITIKTNSLNRSVGISVNSKAETVSTSELVMVMRPTIVRFGSSKGKA